MNYPSVQPSPTLADASGLRQKGYAMPFQSKAQQRFMFARHPKIAKRWAEETPNMKGLPEKKKPSGIKGMAKGSVGIMIMIGKKKPK